MSPKLEDFGHDTWWLVIVKILAVFVFLVVMTLFAIVFSGNWGTPSARNRVIAIPTIAQGYTGRAK